MSTITETTRPSVSVTPESIYRKALVRCFYRWKNQQPRLLNAYMKSCGVARWSEIPTHMSPVELCELFWVAASLPANSTVLEFGSYYGRSSCVLAGGASRKSSTVYCVDSWENNTMSEGEKDTFPIFKKNVLPLMGSVVPLRQWTTETKSEQIDNKVMLGFIDADHSYEGVSSDLKTMLPLLDSSASLFLHDTNSFSGVSRALGELLESGEWKLVKLVDSLAHLRRANWEHKAWVGHD